MRREFHVRFCEGGGVRFLSATRRVILFSQEEDARRVLNILPKRFGRYGLTLHPEKTRLVEFRRPGPRPWGGDGKEPGNFELLGFNHHWARSHAGKWFVRRTTSKSRFSRAVKSVVTWCRRNRHRPIQEQWQHLKQMVRGHYGYYGIPGNSRGLSNFYCEVRRRWQKWLNRRSQRRNMSWARMLLLLERFPLPQPKLITQPA